LGETIVRSLSHQQLMSQQETKEPTCCSSP
jgi:hypothetical protein